MDRTIEVAATGLTVFVAHGDLALGVRTEHRLLAGLAGLGQQAQDLVGKQDRRRHQFVGLAAGVAEHDALVAGTFVLVAAGIHALGNVGGLRMQVNGDVAVLPMEAVLLVADVLDGHARKMGEIFVGDGCRAAGFPGDHDTVGGGQGFTGHARFRHLAEIGIHDSIRNAVTNLVRVTLRTRIRR